MLGGRPWPGDWLGRELEQRLTRSDPIVPRRVTEYGRLMYEGDLGLPINTTPAYFWLGKDAEASDAGIR